MSILRAHLKKAFSLPSRMVVRGAPVVLEGFSLVAQNLRFQAPAADLLLPGPASVHPCQVDPCQVGDPCLAHPYRPSATREVICRVPDMSCS